MASRAPLGEVGVAVDGSIEPLLKKFAAAEKAADAFYKKMAAKLAKVPVNGATSAGGNASSDKSVDRTGKALEAAAKSGNHYHQTLIQVANDNRTIIQIVDNSTRTFNNQRLAIDASSRSLTNISNNYRQAGSAAERETNRASDAASNLRRTLLASASVLVGAFGVNEVKNLADGYTRFTNQLKVAGLEGANLTGTQETLYGQAQKYGVELESLGTLYGRLAQSQTALGATSAQMIQFTNGVGAALKIQGAGANESKGALLQLSQALGSPIVRAEEFNSVNEGARPILQAVANGIDKYKGSVAALRNDVIKGTVTSQEFFQGFLKGSAQLEAQSAKANLTIGASFTTLNNALGRYIGQTDQSLSATARVGAGIKLLADNLDTIVPIITGIIIAMGSRYVVAAASFVGATNLGQAALFAFRGQALASVGALGAAAASAGVAGRALLAAFGGPIGLAVTAVAAAIYAFHLRTAAASKAIEDYNQHQREATKILVEENARAIQAASAIKALGSNHTSATGSARAFAGATGDAAKALREQAREARNARIQILALAIEQAKTDKAVVDGRVAAYKNSAGGGTMGVGYMANHSDRTPDMDRQDELKTRIAALELAANNVINTRLEDSYKQDNPNWNTQGRDLKAEIASYQKQLTAIGTTGSEIARKSLLDEIKMRQRILALMKTGLSIEVATATASAEKIKTGPAAEDGAHRLGRPVVGGTIRGTVGEKRPGHTHAGTDYAVPVGTPVSATAGGTVIESGTLPGYGNVVIIDHGRGLTTRYAHLSKLAVGKGATVSQGDQIGLSGGARGAAGAGNSQGPHLHYEVRKGGKPVDPNGLYGTDEVDAANKAEQLANKRVQDEQTFANESKQLNESISGAKRDQLIDEIAIHEAALKKIKDERDAEAVEIENRRKRGQYGEGGVGDARAKELIALNEQARLEQNSAENAKERQRLEGVATRLAEEQNQRKMEQLQTEQDLARTATERRNVERRILEAQKEFERRTLQATIDSPFTKPEDRDRAKRDMGELDQRYRGRQSGLDRDAMEEMWSQSPENSKYGVKDRVRAVERDRDDKIGTINEVQQDRMNRPGATDEDREQAMQEGADRRVAIERDAADKILEIQNAQRNMQLEAAQSTADSLLSILENTAGRQSGVYKAMFAVSKAFAIAESIVKIQQALASATASLPFPANLPVIAMVAAQGASIISSISAVAGGFQKGGYTGDGPVNSVAGAVHGQEYVFDANATRRIGKANLDSIRAGRNPTMGIRAAANDSGGLANAGASNKGRVNVKQMPGVAIEYRESMTTGDVEIIAQRAVERHAPGVVASNLDRPNSPMRKSVQRNTTARGRKS